MRQTSQTDAIYSYLESNQHKEVSMVVSAVGLDRKRVNSILYRRSDLFTINYINPRRPQRPYWSLKSVTRQAPTVTSQVPTVTRQAPTVTSQAPTVTRQAPTVTSQAPTVTSQVPTVTSQVPTVTRQAPTVTSPPVTCQTKDDDDNEECPSPVIDITSRPSPEQVNALTSNHIPPIHTENPILVLLYIICNIIGNISSFLIFVVLVYIDVFSTLGPCFTS